MAYRAAGRLHIVHIHGVATTRDAARHEVMAEDAANPCVGLPADTTRRPGFAGAESSRNRQLCVGGPLLGHRKLLPVAVDVITAFHERRCAACGSTVSSAPHLLAAPAPP